MNKQGGIQKVKFIDEESLFKLVCNSQLPNAERFQDWLTDEVLPIIKETSTFTTGQTPLTTLASTDNVKQDSQQSQFVFLKDGEPYTNSEIIAQNCEVTHHAVQVLIDKYKKDFEEFELVSFEMRAVKHSSGTKYEKIYNLNEQQATLLITYMKNTEVVRAFKKELVKQFFAMRQYITQQQNDTHTTLQANPQTQLTKPVTAVEYLEITKSIADWLKVNNASKVKMISTTLSNCNLPTNILPSYIDSKGELLSCTECLKHINAKVNTKTFNLILLGAGYLEERQRPSTHSETGLKKYKALTEKGLEFGKNQVSPNNPKEVQPLYYVDKFQDLYNKLTAES